MQVERQFVHRVMSVLGLASAFIFVFFVLWFLREAILLFFAAILFAIFLRGLSSFIGKTTHLPFGWSFFLTLVLLICLTGLVFWRIGPNIADQMGKLFNQLPGALNSLKGQFANSPLGQSLFKSGPNGPSGYFAELIGHAAGFLSTTIGALAGLILVLFVGIYLAINSDLYLNGFVALIPVKNRPRAAQVLDETAYVLRWWLLGTFIDMSIVGVLTGLGLWLLGVPLALSLAIVEGVLTFIPFVGPILGAVPAILITLAVGLNKALYVVILYVVIHLIEGNITSPLIARKMVALPPVLSITAVIVLGLFGGLLGIMLAAPITAVLLVLVKRLYVEGLIESRPDLP